MHIVAWVAQLEERKTLRESSFMSSILISGITISARHFHFSPLSPDWCLILKFSESCTKSCGSYIGSYTTTIGNTRIKFMFTVQCSPPICHLFYPSTWTLQLKPDFQHIAATRKPGTAVPSTSILVLHQAALYKSRVSRCNLSCGSKLWQNKMN